MSEPDRLDIKFSREELLREARRLNAEGKQGLGGWWIDITALMYLLSEIEKRKKL